MENSIEKYINTIKDINSTINSLFEQDDDQRRKDVQSIKSDIEYLRNLLYDKQLFNLGFSKVQIKFLGEYELKLPKYGVESFDRNLKDEMYFKVIGGTEEYMDIKTNSFPKTFKIRLYYKTLKEYEKQSGDAYLIYKRGSQYLEGDETNIKFIITKKI